VQSSGARVYDVVYVRPRFAPARVLTSASVRHRAPPAGKSRCGRGACEMARRANPPFSPSFFPTGCSITPSRWNTEAGGAGQWRPPNPSHSDWCLTPCQASSFRLQASGFIRLQGLVFRV